MTTNNQRIFGAYGDDIAFSALDNNGVSVDFSEADRIFFKASLFPDASIIVEGGATVSDNVNIATYTVKSTDFSARGTYNAFAILEFDNGGTIEKKEIADLGQLHVINNV